jgi:hypothetical protein
MRWTQDDLDAVRHRLTLATRPGYVHTPKRSKFRNVAQTVDGRRFASKKEANYYLQLKLAQAMGQIRGFACQVSIPLPSGKRRMVVDFMVCNLDGTIHWRDAKGFATPEWKTKKDELEHALGIRIETV